MSGQSIDHLSYEEIKEQVREWEEYEGRTAATSLFNFIEVATRATIDLYLTEVLECD